LRETGEVEMRERGVEEWRRRRREPHTCKLTRIILFYLYIYIFTVMR
jgi:hypothetical protein